MEGARKSLGNTVLLLLSSAKTIIWNLFFQELSIRHGGGLATSNVQGPRMPLSQSIKLAGRQGLLEQRHPSHLGLSMDALQPDFISVRLCLKKQKCLDQGKRLKRIQQMLHVRMLHVTCYEFNKCWIRLTFCPHATVLVGGRAFRLR